MRAYRKVNDKYEFRVDGGRLGLLGVGAALVVLLVFLLGVLVAVGVSGLCLNLGARYLLKRLQLNPAMLLRSGG